MVAHVQIPEPIQRSVGPTERTPIVLLRTEGLEDMHGHVRSVTKAGALVEAPRPVMVGQEIDITLADATTVRSRVVWADSNLFGCKFDQLLSERAVKTAKPASKQRLDHDSSSWAGHALLAKHDRWPGWARVATYAAVAIACWSAFIMASEIAAATLR